MRRALIGGLLAISLLTVGVAAQPPVLSAQSVMIAQPVSLSAVVSPLHVPPLAALIPKAPPVVVAPAVVVRPKPVAIAPPVRVSPCGPMPIGVVCIRTTIERAPAYNCPCSTQYDMNGSPWPIGTYLPSSGHRILADGKDYWILGPWTPVGLMPFADAVQI